MTDNANIASADEIEQTKKEEETPEFNLWAEFETDENAEEAGVWYEIVPGNSFKLRRFNSKHAIATRERLMKPYANLTRNGKELPEHIQDEVVTKQMVESIIVDWKGIKDREGNDLEFTPANVMMVLKGLPHLRAELISFVLKIENYRSENVEQAEKNS